MRLLITFCTYCSIQLLASGVVDAATVQLVCDAEASPRIAFGVERLKEALADAGLEVLAVDAATVRPEDTVISVGKRKSVAVRALAPPVGPEVQDRELGPEGFSLLAMGSKVAVIGEGDSGVLYGCLELASHIRDQGGLPNELAVTNRPAFKLRGTCIGMQKPYRLPGRQIYEYPSTEELFPFFYDKAFWREYLDFLVDRRMNLLSLPNPDPRRHRRRASLLPLASGGAPL